MSDNASADSVAISGYRYQSPDIPAAAIRRFARQLGERFHPERIFLFGSYHDLICFHCQPAAEKLLP
jgi:hypothetical protein